MKHASELSKLTTTVAMELTLATSWTLFVIFSNLNVYFRLKFDRVNYSCERLIMVQRKLSQFWFWHNTDSPWLTQTIFPVVICGLTGAILFNLSFHMLSFIYTIICVLFPFLTTELLICCLAGCINCITPGTCTYTPEMVKPVEITFNLYASGRMHTVTHNLIHSNRNWLV